MGKNGTSARDAAIISDYLANSTLREVGAKHGISHERVRQILTRHGVGAFPRGVTAISRTAVDMLSVRGATLRRAT